MTRYQKFTIDLLTFVVNQKNPWNNYYDQFKIGDNSSGYLAGKIINYFSIDKKFTGVQRRND